MMKKTIKIIIFAIALLISANVYAADSDKLCDIKILGGGAQGDKLYFDFRLNNIQIFSKNIPNYFYTAELAGQTAFCVNPGRARGTTYVDVGSAEEIFGTDAAQLMTKAYNFFESSDKSLRAREYAQLMIWVAAKSGSNGNTLNFWATTFIHSFLNKQKGGYIYKNNACYIYDERTGSLKPADSNNCNEISVIVQAFMDMEKLSSTDSGSSLCNASIIKNNKKWKYFNCDIYQKIQGSSSYNDLMDDYGVPKTAHNKADGENRQNFINMYNELKAMSLSEYNAFIAQNNASSQVGAGIEAQIANDLAPIMTQFQGASVSDYKNLRVWCAYGTNYNKSTIKASSVSKQCFVVKNPKTTDQNCPTTCSQLKLTKDYGPGKKYKTCDEIKKANILKANESCSEKNGVIELICKGGSGNNTCSELIDKAKKENWSCETLKSQITDPGSVQCENNKPTSCEPDRCKPEIKVNEKKAQCISKGQDPNDATFTLSDTTTGEVINKECINKDIGYNKNNTTVGSIDQTGLSNKYCNVYCWESLSAVMPDEPYTITKEYAKSDVLDIAKAGRLFFWGTDFSTQEFATMTVKRICWTTPNYTAFESDWSEVEGAISTYNSEYTKYINYRDSKDANAYKSSECDITAECVGGYQASTSNSNERYCDTSKEANCTSLRQETINGLTVDWCSCSTTTESKCDCPAGYTRDGDHCKKDAKGTEYSKTVGDITGTISTCYESAPDDINDKLDHIYDDKISSLYSTIKGLLSQRQTNYNFINACQKEKTKDQLYKSSPKLMLQRDAYVKGDKIELNRSELNQIDNTATATGTTTKTLTCTSVHGDFSTLVGPCSNNSSTSYKKHQEYQWSFTGSYTFTYPSSFHHYVLSPTATVVSGSNNVATTSLQKQLAENGLVYDVGVGYMAKFSTLIGYLDLSVSVSNLGTCVDQKCSKYHFDTIVKNAHTILDFENNSSNSKFNASDAATYTCPVYINNDEYGSECKYYLDENGLKQSPNSKNPEFCPKGVSGENPPDPDGPPEIYPCTNCDLDIVYRLIDMGSNDNRSKEEIKNDVFPGKEGKGRELGTNWESFYTRNYEKFKYITNFEKIYESKPIYEIELTSSAITEIRNDNNNYRKSSNNGGAKDPYTSYYDANNKLKIKCNSKDGIEHTCTSDYITTLINKGVISGRLASASASTRLKYLENYKCYYDTGKLSTKCTANNLVY